MHRIDKTLIVLTLEEAERISRMLAGRDSLAALRVLKDVLGKKVELALKKRCR